MAYLSSKRAFHSMQIIVQAIVFSLPALGSVPPRKIETAELQWAFCNTSAPAMAETLELPVEKQKSRFVYFIDTANMDFFAAGIVNRIRQGTSTDISVKKNYSSENMIPWSLINEHSMICEEDSYTNHLKFGCSLKNKNSNGMQLSTEQIRLLKNLGVDRFWSSSRTWGPVTEQVLKIAISNSEEEIELSEINGHVELSVRVEISQKDYFKAKWSQKIQFASNLMCSVQSGRTEYLLRQLIAHQMQN